MKGEHPLCSLSVVFLQFLDLAAKQSDFLSTVIGGLTVELASGKYDGAVILRRESLQVSYRVRGGDTDGGYHKVLGKMNWSDIVSWSLVHQVSELYMRVCTGSEGELCA